MVSGMFFVCLEIVKPGWQELDLEHDVENFGFYPEVRVEFLSGPVMN